MAIKTLSFVLLLPVSGLFFLEEVEFNLSLSFNLALGVLILGDLAGDLVPLLDLDPDFELLPGDPEHNLIDFHYALSMSDFGL